jgi:dehydrogenase/reductase SDR family protein 12
MDFATLKKLVQFYTRFTPSYSKIGYLARGLFLRNYSRSYEGQNWIVTGASGGIGEAIVKEGVRGGAHVVAVARDESKLERLSAGLGDKRAQLRYVVADMATVRGVKALVDQLVSEDFQYDVLFNNVGVLFNSLTLTEERKEATFVTNLLSHYCLTEGLAENGKLKANSVVINMTSGGMYNSPLTIDTLNVTDPEKYLGKAAYAAHKRGQAVLTGYWNQRFGDQGISFYVMHPGWAKTAGVKSALPVFYRLQNLILRTPFQGAETAFWLIATRPDTSTHIDYGVWFDHKLRPAHMFEVTKAAKCSVEEFVTFLNSELVESGAV